MATFRVLAIDGGGIRGIVPAVTLQYIEKKLERPICECFNLVAGTSTGGLLALGLLKPELTGSQRQPHYSASDMLNLYVEEGPRIFHDSLPLRTFFRPKYRARPIEQVLDEYFGDARLRDCLTPALITAYDIEGRSPRFFKSIAAREEPDTDDFSMCDVARATSAAPTFFEPHLIGEQSSVDRLALVDGGVFANNPALCAYSEATKILAKREAPAEGHGDESQDQIVVLSLGTGAHTRRYEWEKARKWALVGWVRPILSIMMDGMSDSVDHHLKHLLPAAPSGTEHYLRIDGELAGADDDMDEASIDNLRALKRFGSEILARHQPRLDRFLEDHFKKR